MIRIIKNILLGSELIQNLYVMCLFFGINIWFNSAVCQMDLYYYLDSDEI